MADLSSFVAGGPHLTLFSKLPVVKTQTGNYGFCFHMKPAKDVINDKLTSLSVVFKKPQTR
jgi:hypothetical protein